MPPAEASNELEELRNSFAATVRRKSDQLTSYDFALETLQYLRKVIIYEKYETIVDLIAVLTSHGRWLSGMEPSELVIRNVVMMVAKLARDESVRLITEIPGGPLVNLPYKCFGAQKRPVKTLLWFVVGTDDREPVSAFDSLNKLWIKTEDNSGAASGKKLKKGLVQAVNEVVSEMSLCCENIAARAGELVNPNDVLIVHNLSGSPTLTAFLAAARAIRKHRVLSVVHSSEFDSTPEFATPIQLYDVGSKMCEVTKVVLPGAAVFPDGSCLVPAGGLSTCLSAQRHSVPVYVLAAFYKITPFFVPDPMMVNPSKAPGVSFKHSASFCGLVEIPRLTFDHIPASLVTLYVSNSACILPSHVYRLIGDYYHPEDVAEC